MKEKCNVMSKFAFLMGHKPADIEPSRLIFVMKVMLPTYKINPWACVLDCRQMSALNNLLTKVYEGLLLDKWLQIYWTKAHVALDTHASSHVSDLSNT